MTAPAGPDHDAVRAFSAEWESAIRAEATQGRKFYTGPTLMTLFDEIDRLRAEVRKLNEAGAEVTRQNDVLHDENRQLRQQINALISRPYTPEVGTQ